MNYLGKDIKNEHPPDGNVHHTWENPIITCTPEFTYILREERDENLELGSIGKGD